MNGGVDEVISECRKEEEQRVTSAVVPTPLDECRQEDVYLSSLLSTRRSFPVCIDPTWKCNPHWRHTAHHCAVIYEFSMPHVYLLAAFFSVSVTEKTLCE